MFVALVTLVLLLSGAGGHHRIDFLSAVVIALNGVTNGDFTNSGAVLPGETV